MLTRGEKNKQGRCLGDCTAAGQLHRDKCGAVIRECARGLDLPTEHFYSAPYKGMAGEFSEDHPHTKAATDGGKVKGFSVFGQSFGRTRQRHQSISQQHVTADHSGFAVVLVGCPLI